MLGASPSELILYFRWFAREKENKEWCVISVGFWMMQNRVGKFLIGDCWRSWIKLESKQNDALLEKQSKQLEFDLLIQIKLWTIYFESGHTSHTVHKKRLKNKTRIGFQEILNFEAKKT